MDNEDRMDITDPDAPPTPKLYIGCLFSFLAFLAFLTIPILEWLGKNGRTVMLVLHKIWHDIRPHREDPDSEDLLDD